jgi:Mrp family chromosome partitioning ATPase
VRPIDREINPQPLRSLSDVDVPWVLTESPDGEPQAVHAAPDRPVVQEPVRSRATIERVTPPPAADDAVVELVRWLFLSAEAEAAGVRRVLFTEVGDEGGAAEIARQVAEVLAEKSDGTVCLADLDSGCSALQRHYAIAGKAGLSDALAGTSTVGECAHPVRSRSNLLIMPAGPATIDGAADSESGPRPLSEVVSPFGHFIGYRRSDTIQSDASGFDVNFDGLVLVVDSASTSPDSLRGAAKALQAAGLRVLGTVLRPSP